MPLLKNGQIVSDTWSVASDDQQVPADSDILVTKQRFLTDREALMARNRPLGLLLTSADTLDGIEEDLKRFQVIAIDFPKYTDGRPYSLAHLIKARHGFDGELRATGDVLPDQVAFMRRCGFDSFDIAGQYVSKITELLSSPPVDLYYQPAPTARAEHETGTYAWRRTFRK